MDDCFSLSGHHERLSCRQQDKEEEGSIPRQWLEVVIAVPRNLQQPNSVLPGEHGEVMTTSLIGGQIFIFILLAPGRQEIQLPISISEINRSEEQEAREIFGVEMNHDHHPRSLLESSGGKGMRHLLLTARHQLPRPVKDGKE